MKNLNIVAPAAVCTSTHKFPWKWYLKDLRAITKNGCKVFSTFSCGGGSSMGYKLAGYELLGNVEIDKKIIKVYRSNLHPRYSYNMDIREFLRKDDIPDELYNLDILDGSPPCSVFSTMGKREAGWGTEKVFREGQAKQRLDDLFFVYAELVKKLRPKVFVAENVTGLLKGNAKGYVNEIIKAFLSGGYVLQVFKLNAAYMGVPQARERIFFIGHQKELDYPKLKLKFTEPVITFGEVREPKGRDIGLDTITARMLARRKPGDTCIADINGRMRGRANTGFGQVIWSDDRPASTCVAGGNTYRFCDGLGATDNDFRNAQTFPQDYDFGTQSAQYICGMSVPPVMMANLASEIYRQWLSR